MATVAQPPPGHGHPHLRWVARAPECTLWCRPFHFRHTFSHSIPIEKSPPRCAGAAEGSYAYASEVRNRLRAAGFYTDCDTNDRKMQKKVRDAQLAQYNYILVRGG